MRKRILNIIFYSLLGFIIIFGGWLSVYNRLRERSEFIDGITNYGSVSDESTDLAVFRSLNAIEILNSEMEGEKQKSRLLTVKYIAGIEELQITILASSDDCSVFVEDLQENLLSYGSGVVDRFGNYQRLIVPHFDATRYPDGFYIVLLNNENGKTQEFDRFFIVPLGIK